MVVKWASVRSYLHPHPHPRTSLMSLLSSKISIYMRKLREITRTKYIYIAYHRPMFLVRWLYHMRTYVCVCVCLHSMRACVRARLCVLVGASRDLHTSVEINRIAVKICTIRCTVSTFFSSHCDPFEIVCNVHKCIRMENRICMYRPTHLKVARLKKDA